MPTKVCIPTTRLRSTPPSNPSTKAMRTGRRRRSLSPPPMAMSASLPTLFLPKKFAPPYQTIIYFPGGAITLRSSDDSMMAIWVIDFIIKSGRAVLYPVYKGTLERQDGLKSDYARHDEFLPRSCDLLVEGLEQIHRLFRDPSRYRPQ